MEQVWQQLSEPDIGIGRIGGSQQWTLSHDNQKLTTKIQTAMIIAAALSRGCCVIWCGGWPYGALQDEKTTR